MVERVGVEVVAFEMVDVVDRDRQRHHLHAEPLDRERTRLLLFLYSDTREQNTGGIYG